MLDSTWYSMPIMDAESSIDGAGRLPPRAELERAVLAHPRLARVRRARWVGSGAVALLFSFSGLPRVIMEAGRVDPEMGVAVLGPVFWLVFSLMLLPFEFNVRARLMKELADGGSAVASK